MYGNFGGMYKCAVVVSTSTCSHLWRRILVNSSIFNVFYGLLVQSTVQSTVE